MKFLVKEIRSKTGDLHFRRYRILWTPWFAIYIHNILKSDEDKHLHDHPWNILIFILKGGYVEMMKDSCCERPPGSLFFHKSTVVHKIKTLYGPTWSFVMTFGKNRLWGYDTEIGWIDHIKYRELKNQGQLPKGEA